MGPELEAVVRALYDNQASRERSLKCFFVDECCAFFASELFGAARLNRCALHPPTCQVPEAWAARAYPSLKPLAAWIDDLLARLAFIGNWVAHGKPAVYWLSGFFFPQVRAAAAAAARNPMCRLDDITVNGPPRSSNLLPAVWSEPL
jgi:hypothetical protein